MRPTPGATRCRPTRSSATPSSATRPSTGSRDHPADATWNYLGKTLNSFAPFDQLGTESENSVPQQALATATYLPLLALFVLRLVRWRRDRPGDVERLLILSYLLAGPAQAIFTTRVRYRVPLEPLLMIVVAASIARWLTRRADDGGADTVASPGDAPVPSGGANRESPVPA